LDKKTKETTAKKKCDGDLYYPLLNPPEQPAHSISLN
jgi:hypothetical protein